MTARLPPENLTRAPSALGSSPARSTSSPAFLSSSLYLPIAARSSSLGTAPGAGSPLIINITRIAGLLLTAELGFGCPVASVGLPRGDERGRRDETGGH